MPEYYNYNNNSYIDNSNIDNNIDDNDNDSDSIIEQCQCGVIPELNKNYEYPRCDKQECDFAIVCNDCVKICSYCMDRICIECQVDECYRCDSKVCRDCSPNNTECEVCNNVICEEHTRLENDCYVCPDCYIIETDD